MLCYKVQPEKSKFTTYCEFKSNNRNKEALGFQKFNSVKNVILSSITFRRKVLFLGVLYVTVGKVKTLRKFLYVISLLTSSITISWLLVLSLPPYIQWE